MRDGKKMTTKNIWKRCEKVTTGQGKKKRCFEENEKERGN